MTPEKMTVICNIQAMEKHCKKASAEFNAFTFKELEKKTIEDLRVIQEVAIFNYNAAINH